MKPILLFVFSIISISTALARPCKIITQADEHEMAYWGSGHSNGISKPAQEYGVKVLAQGIYDPNKVSGWDYSIGDRSGPTKHYKKYLSLDSIIDGNFNWSKHSIYTVVIDTHGNELFRVRQQTYKAPDGYSSQNAGNFEGRAVRKAIKFIGENMTCN